MAYGDNDAANRIRAAAPAVAVHVLLGLALIYGLAGGGPGVTTDATTRSFDVLPDAPPPLPPPPPTPAIRHRAERSPAPRPEGASAPANLQAQPRPLEAPEPVVPLPLPIPAAPIAGTGAANSAGAAPVPGPGTGAGGSGIGTGSGAAGNGMGGGGDGGGGRGDGGPIGELRPPRQVGGSMSIRDMPESLREGGFSGRVGVIYRVEADGHVTNCRITHRSGSALMDQITCRLIEQRFRFRPARDETGRPFAGDIYEDHSWESDADPPQRRRHDDDDD